MNDSSDMMDQIRRIPDLSKSVDMSYERFTRLMRKLKFFRSRVIAMFFFGTFMTVLFSLINKDANK